MLSEYRNNRQVAASSSSSSVPSFMPQQNQQSEGYFREEEENENNQDDISCHKDNDNMVSLRSYKQVHENTKPRRLVFRLEGSPASFQQNKKLTIKKIQDSGVIAYDAGSGKKGGVLQQGWIISGKVISYQNDFPFFVDVTSSALGGGNGYDAETGSRFMFRMLAEKGKNFEKGVDVYRHKKEIYSDVHHCYAAMTEKDITLDVITTSAGRFVVIPVKSYLGGVITATHETMKQEGQNPSVVVVTEGYDTPEVIKNISRCATLVPLPNPEGEASLAYIVSEETYNGSREALMSIIKSSPFINFDELDIAFTRGGRDWKSTDGLRKYARSGALIDDISKTEYQAWIEFVFIYKLPQTD